MPSIDSLMAGDVKRKQQMVAEVRLALILTTAAEFSQILEGSYKATFGPDEVTQEPFAADLVIANPPTFAHVHLAEKLGVPLHMIFSALYYLYWVLSS